MLRRAIEGIVDILLIGWPAIVAVAIIAVIGHGIWQATDEQVAMERACAERCYPLLSVLSRNSVCVCAAPRGDE